MTTTTIRIKKIYLKEGVRKNGSVYKLTKLLGEDSNYYSSFSKLPDLQEGDTITAEVEQSDKAGYFDIKKILSVEESWRGPRPSFGAQAPAGKGEAGRALEEAGKTLKKIKIEMPKFDYEREAVESLKAAQNAAPDDDILQHILVSSIMEVKKSEHITRLIKYFDRGGEL